MFDQLRPPTDNLYKFLALSGLALFIFACYVAVTSDIELQKFRRLADEADYLRDSYMSRYNDNVADVDEELQAKRIDEQKAFTKKKALYDKMIAATSRYKKDLEEAKTAAHRIDIEFRSRYQVLNTLMWVGGSVAVVGFWLWYVRLQKPLDEIMRYDLEERRGKAQKATV